MTSRALVVGLAFSLAACGGSTRSSGADGGAGASGSPSSGGTAGKGGASGGSPSTGGRGGASGGGDAGTSSGGGPANGGSPSHGGAGGSDGGGSDGNSDAGTCIPTVCDPFRNGACCNNACTNLANDPRNCGKCGVVCLPGTPLCSGGTCIVPSCGDPMLGAPPPTCQDPASCCGAKCCKSNEICCAVHFGGASFGLELGCYDPLQSEGTCPRGCPNCVCASPDTPIATPEGDKAIAVLKVGDLVYSVDHGEVVVVPLVRVNRTPVNRHTVVRVRLATGAVLEISALHPTADGRQFGGLRVGDALDGVEVVAANAIPYEHDATYDILPDSDSGAYFAGGVLVGSTLATRPTLVSEPTIPATLATPPRARSVSTSSGAP